MIRFRGEGRTGLFSFIQALNQFVLNKSLIAQGEKYVNCPGFGVFHFTIAVAVKQAIFLKVSIHRCHLSVNLSTCAMYLKFK